MLAAEKQSVFWLYASICNSRYSCTPWFGQATIEEAHDGAQTEGHAAGVAHAVPQDHGQDIRIGAAGRRLPPLVDNNQERDQQHDQRLSFAAHYSCRYDILS